MPGYPTPWQTWLGPTPDVGAHFQTRGGKPPVSPVYCSTPTIRPQCPSNILYFCSALIVPPEVPLRPDVQTIVGLPYLMTTRLISLLPETPAGAVPSTLFGRISGRPYLWRYVVYFLPGRVV